MKNLVLCLCFLWCSLAQAAIPIDADMNGEYWRRLDDKMKSAFLAGFMLGSNQHPFGSRGDQTVKLVPLIDAFYKTYGNYPLLRYAIKVGVMQIEGRPQPEIDAVIEQAEKAWK
jgi:hypothetical protein